MLTAIDQGRPRRTRRRRMLTGAIAALLAVGAVGYTAGVASAPIPAAAAEVVQPSVTTVAEAERVLPSRGTAAITVLADDDGLVRSDGAEVFIGDREPVEMASITKLVVALMLLERTPLEGGAVGPTITFREADVRIWRAQLAQNASTWPVAVGQRTTFRDALTVMLLESAGNWAESLVLREWGSEEAWAEAARVWLDEHGLTDTTVDNPEGWQPNASTTADLLELGRIAIANPVIASIVGLDEAQVGEAGTVENSNLLVGRLGIDGLKTGSLYDSFNLLFSVSTTIDGEPVRAVGVVLGAPSRDVLYERVRRIVEHLVDGFSTVEVGAVGDAVATWRTAWGAEATAVQQETVRLQVWGDPPIEAIATASSARPDGDAPTAAISVTGVADGPTVAAGEPIDGPDFWWSLTNPVARLGG